MLFWLNYNNSNRYRYISGDDTFIGFDSSEICPRCGRNIVTPKFREAIPHFESDGGKIYPDYIQFCGAGKYPFIVSEKALSIFEENNVSGYNGATLVRVEPSGISSDGSQIRYFQLNIYGHIELDFKAMFLKKKNYCEVCGQYEWNRQRFYPRFIDESTWDGSDFAVATSVHWRLCSEKVNNIIQNHKLTGFVLTEARIRE